MDFKQHFRDLLKASGWTQDETARQLCIERYGIIVENVCGTQNAKTNHFDEIDSEEQSLVTRPSAI